MLDAGHVVQNDGFFLIVAYTQPSSELLDKNTSRMRCSQEDENVYIGHVNAFVEHIYGSNSLDSVR